MKRMTTPWRRKYIEGHIKEDGCVFCNALAKTEDNSKNLIVHRGQRAFVIVNLFPYTNGHLMVAPMDHKASLELLDSETRAEMMELSSQAIVILKNIYHPQAFNVGANIGKAAGAGVPDHVHMHIVPRWAGDSNFMSVLGETRVLPETIEETYERVRKGWG
ncbi:MAG: HIT family hydrolase [Anaerolineae bacterium]|nr:HIT domain-containing protein [Chloroflexi bacterium CFX1]MCQ3947329.1 HIT family hydrolase [Anaerolineae bacterium]MCZ2289780.1 HIT domain-containing protein [Anaerolineales bacterium]RIK24897.1 MAG: HIT family hydrolase [Anaerolineae bacterium]